jgi:hypothetical protein
MVVLDISIVGFGYVGGFLIGSYLLRRILLFVDPSLHEFTKPNLDFRDVGLWIGICEHFLIVTFVLMDAYIAIGLIFAAKEIVRAEKIREKPSYYLLGTLLSTSFAVLFGVLTKLVLRMI